MVDMDGQYYTAKKQGLMPEYAGFDLLFLRGVKLLTIEQERGFINVILFTKALLAGVRPSRLTAFVICS